MFAEVAVDSSIPSRIAFSYSIPSHISLLPGQAVYVPFGRRTLQGIVLAVTEQPAYSQTRDVLSILDPEPLVSIPRIDLARWMSAYYLAPLFDCIALMLPAGFRRRPITYYEMPPLSAGGYPPSLTEQELAILSYVQRKKRAAEEQMQDDLHMPKAGALAQRLERAGLLSRSYGLARPKVSQKVVTYVRLLVAPDEAKAMASALAVRAKRQALVLRLLADESPTASLASLRSRAGVNRQALEKMAQQGIVSLEEITVERDPLAGLHVEMVDRPVLTPAQEAAYQQIAEAIEPPARRSEGQHAPFLLYGVTGSGKTEVYLEAMSRTVELGKRAIVLVPEIALTPQTIRRFEQRFPGRVAVLHSALSPGEQHDQWYAIRRGRYDVVIGSRSAVFAPQPDLGLIVLDEEHEWTYKQQEPDPRYHARLVAERLAELAGAVLVLGSATPALESYNKAQRGYYRLLELPERVRSSPNKIVASAQAGSLPAVEVADMRSELHEGNYGIFSHALSRALADTLRQGGQAILFVNRRGSASFVLCRDCGYVPRCSSCAVSLTYHADEQTLICHYCRRQKRASTVCPQCLSTRLRYLGLGTQKVEEDVLRLFPQARVLRWDRDSTRSRGAHERILERFLSQDADVLVGTQMIAKGLDLPSVTLVGIVAADLGLHLPDFPSAERTFQLLCQVAGRAGRGPEAGRAIIQTYSPDHYAIQAAAQHDYPSFYEKESALRKLCSYPPFGRLARLVYAHTGQAYAQHEAQRFAAVLQRELARLGLPNTTISGPSPPFVQKVRGRYRWQIIIRSQDPGQLLADIALPKGWSLDIDPVSLL